MLTAVGMWPMSYLRAAGRASTIVTPAGWGNTACCLTRARSARLGYQFGVAWTTAGAGSSAACAGLAASRAAPINKEPHTAATIVLELLFMKDLLETKAPAGCFQPAGNV